MTESELKYLIEKLNREEVDLIYLRPLTSTVDFAKVWLDKPEIGKEISPFGADKFYFIKSEVGFYIAAVFDMDTNLHWYVDEKYRKKGYLTRNLKGTILPHLFQDRTNQRITIDEKFIGRSNWKASKKVAAAVGFKKVSDKEFILSNDDYNHLDYIEGENTELSRDEIIAIKNKILYHATSLSIIQTEIEMKLGMADYVDDLGEIIKDIKSQAHILANTFLE